MTHVSLTTTLVLRLNVATAEKLKSLGLFDVMALPVELKQLYDLRTQPSRFLDVLFCLVDQSASDEPLTVEQFSAQVTDAEIYGRLWEAFTREVTDFFREPMRPAIATVFQMLEQAESERVAGLMATIQASLSQIESNSPGDWSGVPRESAVLIPDLSHCDSLTIWPAADAEKNGAAMLDSVLSPPTATDHNDSPSSTSEILTPIEILLAS